MGIQGEVSQPTGRLLKDELKQLGKYWRNNVMTEGGGKTPTNPRSGDSQRIDCGLARPQQLLKYKEGGNKPVFDRTCPLSHPVSEGTTCFSGTEENLGVSWAASVWGAPDCQGDGWSFSGEALEMPGLWFPALPARGGTAQPARQHRGARVWPVLPLPWGG